MTTSYNRRPAYAGNFAVPIAALPARPTQQPASSGGEPSATNLCTRYAAQEHKPISEMKGSSTLDKNTITNAANDLGFGNFKGARRTANGIQSFTFPSIVGVGERDMGILDLGGVGRRRRGREPFRVSYDGIETLVGEGVDRYTTPIERMDYGRLTDDCMELRSFVYAGLHQMLGGGDHAVNLVAGLPVDLFQAPDARGRIRQLKSWLIGEHRFVVNGLESVVTIQAIRPLAQPVGAVFAWGLDDSGKWFRDQTDFEADVAVLDLGFNTLDLFVVRGGQIDARYTGGETLGMRRAATIVVDMVRAKCQRELFLHEADQLVRQFINGKRTLDLTVADETFDIRNVVKTAVDSAAGRVLGYVERNWGNGRQFSKLLLVGGGCLALGPRLQALFRHATLLPDPVTANVRGMAKLAQRPGTFR